jgi:hypothetical protein
MTKPQVLEMIDKGVKVSHKHFTGWIMKHPKSKGNYIDEKKNVYTVTNFWRWRTSGKWLKDWSVHIKQ